MHIAKASGVSFVVWLFSFAAPAQQPAPGPPETPRHALIEIVTGGEKGFMKHLTLEVLESLKKPGNMQTSAMLKGLGMDASFAGKGLQAFETGPILFTFNEPAEHKTLEVHVENDDLNGEEDDLELSLHSLQDGQEQVEDWQAFASHFTVSMKRQANIWRLNKITVRAEFPIGDPTFIDTLFKKTTGDGVTGMAATLPETQTNTAVKVDLHSDANPLASSQQVPPEMIVRWLGLAESTFALQNPEKGFTCSFSELSHESAGFGAGQLAKGDEYYGYRFTLSNCEGKPAGSFRITAEPMVPLANAKAFCVNATQNVRSSDDGRGATCITSGKAWTGVGSVSLSMPLSTEVK